MKIVLNINIRSVLIFDRNLVGGDEVVRSSSFSACCDGGRSCHSAVLRGDHHCDVVWWSGGQCLVKPLGTWSGGLVVGARRSRSGRGLVVWYSDETRVVPLILMNAWFNGPCKLKVYVVLPCWVACPSCMNTMHLLVDVTSCMEL